MPDSIGGPHDIGEMTALVGDEFSRPFVGAYRHQGQLIGIVTVNAPKAFAICASNCNSTPVLTKQ